MQGIWRLSRRKSDQKTKNQGWNNSRRHFWVHLPPQERRKTGLIGVRPKARRLFLRNSEKRNDSTGKSVWNPETFQAHSHKIYRWLQLFEQNPQV